MCIIIDTNTIHKVFANPPNPDFQPILDWIEKRDGILVYGGRFSDEILNAGEKVRRLFKVWGDAGRALRMDAKKVERSEEDLRNVKMRSNDPHVIAVAIVSGARTLVTSDKDLIKDFKDRSVLPSPKGKIYSYAGRQDVLKHTKGCKGRPKK